MATSSIMKNFTIETKAETDAFMSLLEESLKKPGTFEDTGVKLASEEYTKKFVEALRNRFGNSTPS